MITHREQVSPSLSSEAIFFNEEGTDDNNIDIDIDPDYEIHNSTSPTCSLEICTTEYFRCEIKGKCRENGIG